MKAQLRRPHLLRLDAAGAVGRLLARQARAHAEDYDQPGDLLNFQYDSVACAAALGWPCVTMGTAPLASVLDVVDDERGVRVAADLDAASFGERWLNAAAALP